MWVQIPPGAAQWAHISLKRRESESSQLVFFCCFDLFDAINMYMCVHTHTHTHTHACHVLRPQLHDIVWTQAVNTSQNVKKWPLYSSIVWNTVLVQPLYTSNNTSINVEDKDTMSCNKNYDVYITHAWDVHVQQQLLQTTPGKARRRPIVYHCPAGLIRSAR